MKKYHFTFDRIKKNKKIKKILLNKYKKPFYGINCGTFVFLMNKYKTFNIDKIISKAKSFFISPLEMKALTRFGKTLSAIAINEVSLLRQSRQAASLQIRNRKKILIKPTN